MGRFTYEDAEHYGSSGSGGYFSLKNDGDIAQVRLLGNGMEDFPGYAVHEVYIDDKRKYVNCLREDYRASKDDCPMCTNGDKIVAKMFIPLYNIAADEVQIWERGKQMMKKLSGFCARHKNVVQWVTEIERNGKAHDTNTTYELYDDGNGPNKDISLDDFEVPDIIGRYILDKSYEDLEYYVEHESFPAEEEDDKPKRSAKSSRSKDDVEEDEAPRSRTSRRGSRGGRRRRDEEEDY